MSTYPAEQEMVELLRGAVEQGEGELGNARVESYEEGGWLTGDAGFVVHMPDGRQFHVTVQEQ